LSPQACTVCEHPERREIDRALGGGEPGRGVARRFGLAEASVRRHRSNHLAAGGASGQETETKGGWMQLWKRPATPAPQSVRDRVWEQIERTVSEVAEGRIAEIEEEHERFREAVGERRELVDRLLELDARISELRGELETLPARLSEAHLADDPETEKTLKAEHKRLRGELDRACAEHGKVAAKLAELPAEVELAEGLERTAGAASRATDADLGGLLGVSGIADDLEQLVRASIGEVRDAAGVLRGELAARSGEGPFGVLEEHRAYLRFEGVNVDEE
jgi:regulator of replication initiation timing